MEPYGFVARLKRAIDGDTHVVSASMVVFVDEWATRDFVVRILGVDTPERRGQTKAEGDAAWRFAADALTGMELRLALTGKKDVYGRWLGDILVGDRRLSEMLVETGHGVEKNYASHITELEAGQWT